MPLRGFKNSRGFRLVRIAAPRLLGWKPCDLLQWRPFQKPLMTNSTLRRRIRRPLASERYGHETAPIEGLPTGGIGRKVDVPAAIDKGAAV